MKYVPLPSQQELRRLFKINPCTGETFWRNRVLTGANAKFNGLAVGSNRSSGYHVVTIAKQKFFLHRIVWQYFYGIDPGFQTVDHIDRNRMNCSIWNLRLAPTRGQQEINKGRMLVRKNKPAGSIYKGVRAHHSGKFSADITKDGKWHFLGYFRTEIEAAQAYNKKAFELFGSFAHLNPI